MKSETTPSLDTVSVWGLHEAVSLAQAWRDWSGFVLLHPGEHSRQPLPFVPTRDMALSSWLKSGYDETSPVHPLGCHFVADGLITGQGYAFSDGRLLQQDAYLSRVARDELAANPDFTPAGSSHRVCRVIEAPVLEIVGPGSPVFGHWIVDFLPRAAIARELLGPAFAQMRIALADHVPRWAEQLLEFHLQIPAEQILRYDMHRETLLCRRLCVPTFAHSGSGYFFHSFAREFYARPRGMRPADRARRLCISRRNFEDRTRGVLKRLEGRGYLEEAAMRLGFEVVCPEEHTVAEQYALFAQAGAIVGEFGSGLHNSLFSAPGIVVGSVGCINSIQHRVAALMSQNVLYVIPEALGRGDDGARLFRIAHDRIEALLAQVVSLHDQSVLQ